MRKVGIDGGGDHFKVVINLIAEETLPKNPKKQKKRHKDSSVKASFLLAVVESIPETYNNVRLILEKLKLHSDKIQFCLASDLKLINIMGQSKS